MFLLVRADGSLLRLPDVAKISKQDGELLCFDDAGAIVERYSPQGVLLYGDEAKISALITRTGGLKAKVQKTRVVGSQESCCAAYCDAPAAVAFTFDGQQGGMKIGLCRVHESLVDDQAKTIVLDDLDLRRVTIFEAKPV